MLTAKPSIGFITGGALGQATINATQWNTVASAVGCGSSKPSTLCQLHMLCAKVAHVDANAAQLACMEAVPFQTLENAVISTGITFNLLTDSMSQFSFG